MFYEAHEHFERAWRQKDGNEREFFRAFLHLSGGFYRLTQDRADAAFKFFTHAEKWFSQFPDMYMGFRVSTIRQRLRQIMAAIDHGFPPGKILSEYFQPVQPAEGYRS